jgi:hypothetical protein
MTLTDSPNPSTITIWQQNVNKSGTCQHNLISSVALARQGIDVVALQELAINMFGATIASRDWIPGYPLTHSNAPHKTRSVLLVRSNILAEQWKQVNFPSGDVMVIQLSGSWGNVYILNIYNDCKKNDIIHQLKAFTDSNINLDNNDPGSNRAGTKVTLWLGDFNCHHPHWDNPTDTRLFTRAVLNNMEILISAVAEAGLDLALPPVSLLIYIMSLNDGLDWIMSLSLEDALDTVITCDTLLNTLCDTLLNMPGITSQY